MVPAAWSPDDYYQASRRARRAWQATQPQQVLPGVLEEVDATNGEAMRSAEPVGNLAAASTPSSTSGVLEAADTGTTPLVVSAASSASPAPDLPSGGRARKGAT